MANGRRFAKETCAFRLAPIIRDMIAVSSEMTGLSEGEFVEACVMRFGQGVLEERLANVRSLHRFIQELRRLDKTRSAELIDGETLVEDEASDGKLNAGQSNGEA